MTQSVVCIVPKDTLRDAVRVIETYHISALPVVVLGRVVGMLTSELFSDMAERRQQ
ncbi:MAG: CBS domain-containing protein [Methanocalculaceae archaeon]|jgi:CBS domain-containing protein|nr:CBS domain-containing protein [Methanocalculaceae archaeon]